MRTAAPLAGILFDKDGTLLDFDATWGPATVAVIAALAEGDEARMTALAEAAGFDHRRIAFHPHSPIIAGDTEAFAPAWAEHLGIAYDGIFTGRVDALYRAESLKSLTAYDDVARSLDTLIAAGLAVGLATNDSEGTARAHLQALGIEDRFAYVAGYDTGHGAKPGPGMVEAFAVAIGVTADRIVMIGDSPHDMEAARLAGAQAIGIARTPAAAAALEGHADVLIFDLDELPARLAGSKLPEAEG